VIVYLATEAIACHRGSPIRGNGTMKARESGERPPVAPVVHCASWLETSVPVPNRHLATVNSDLHQSPPRLSAIGWSMNASLRD
jgi:hypothetical protein